MEDDRDTLKLINAVIANDPDTVNKLLNAGIDPNDSLDESSVTPLHYAAQNNALLVVPLLVEAGANLYAKTDPDGLTPLEIAIMHGNHKVTQILLAYSANNDEHAH